MIFIISCFNIYHVFDIFFKVFFRGVLLALLQLFHNPRRCGDAFFVRLCVYGFVSYKCAFVLKQNVLDTNFLSTLVSCMCIEVFLE